MSRRSKLRSNRSSIASNSASQLFENISTFREDHGRKIYGCSFCPFSRDIFYFATVGHNRVTIYKVENDEVELLRCYRDAAKDELYYAVCWAFDPDYNEHSVVVGGQRGVAHVVEANSGKVICSLTGHGGAVNDIKVCLKDSTIIATASEDFSARIWDTRNESCLAILGGVLGHLDQVLSLDFDSSCNYLATASMDHTIKMWYIGEGSGVDKMVAQAKSSLKLIDMPVEIHFPYCSTRDIHPDYVDSVCIFHKMIFSKSVENQIDLWKFGSFEDGLAGSGSSIKTDTDVRHFRKLALPDGGIWFVRCAIDPNKKYLFCGNQMAAIHVWDLTKGLPSKNSDYVLMPKGMKGPIRQISFSSCGRYFIAVADDASVSLFIDHSQEMKSS